MPNPDLIAEHAALLRERAELQKLCMDEWGIMPAQAAKQRQDRLWEIRDRLLVIQRTQAWKRRDA